MTRTAALPFIIVALAAAGCSAASTATAHQPAAATSSAPAPACPGGAPRIQETTGGPWVCDPDAPVSAPASAPPSTPATSPADITLSCASYNDPAGEGALGSGPTAQVTMVTSDFVAATEVDVTVIDFDAAGDQAGTEVLKFGGPFAAGQTFQQEPETTNGDTSSCGIASVSSDQPVTFDNLSPVPGAS